MSVAKLRLVANVIAGLIVFGCASATPGPTPKASAPTPSPSVMQRPSGASSPAPTIEPSYGPSVTSFPPAPTVEPSEVPSATSLAPMSRLEQDLVFGLRADAQVDCAPRRSNLPPRAIAGVECRVRSDLVDRVGIYAFSSQADAFSAYLARLESVGVALRSGNCGAGTSGDSAWIPGDGPAYAGDLPYRLGCYRDENGNANIRLTCWGGDRGGVYVGVLGAKVDIADLHDWVWRWPEGATDAYTPSSPRICNDQGVGPGPDPDFPGTVR